jgi:hypothetical protein
MDGIKLFHYFCPGGLSHFKASHPNTPNNIIQMRSDSKQVPFYAGARANIPYYLGLATNNSIEHRKIKSILTETQKVTLQHKMY